MQKLNKKSITGANYKAQNFPPINELIEPQDEYDEDQHQTLANASFENRRGGQANEPSKVIFTPTANM